MPRVGRRASTAPQVPTALQAPPHQVCAQSAPLPQRQVQAHVRAASPESTSQPWGKQRVTTSIQATTRWFTRAFSSSAPLADTALVKDTPCVTPALQASTNLQVLRRFACHARLGAGAKKVQVRRRDVILAPIGAASRIAPHLAIVPSVPMARLAQRVLRTRPGAWLGHTEPVLLHSSVGRATLAPFRGSQARPSALLAIVGITARKAPSSLFHAALGAIEQSTARAHARLAPQASTNQPAARQPACRAQWAAGAERAQARQCFALPALIGASKMAPRLSTAPSVPLAQLVPLGQQCLCHAHPALSVCAVDWLHVPSAVLASTNRSRARRFVKHVLLAHTAHSARQWPSNAMKAPSVAHQKRQWPPTAQTVLWVTSAFQALLRHEGAALPPPPLSRARGSVPHALKARTKTHKGAVHVRRVHLATTAPPARPRPFLLHAMPGRT